MTSFRDLAANAALCAAVFLGFLALFPFLLVGHAYLAAEEIFRKDRNANLR